MGSFSVSVSVVCTLVMFFLESLYVFAPDLWSARPTRIRTADDVVLIGFDDSMPEEYLVNLYIFQDLGRNTRRLVHPRGW